MTTPAHVNAIPRAAHRATVDTVVRLARDGWLGADGRLDEHGAGATALVALGIRPPAGYLAQARARFPAVYGALDETPPGDFDDSLLKALARQALTGYVADLIDLLDKADELQADGVGWLDREGWLADLAAGVSPAEVAADVLEQTRDEYDRLLGESYAPTHGA